MEVDVSERAYAVAPHDPADRCDRRSVKRFERGRRRAAGPLCGRPFAPFAGEYFDRMAGLGGTVDLLFPNGNLYCKATLEGIDVWGRICVETDDGRDVEYSPEQVSCLALPVSDRSICKVSDSHSSSSGGGE